MEDIILHIDGKRCMAWDELTIDSDIGVPADAFSLKWFGDSKGILPTAIAEGKLCKVSISNDGSDEVVLVGILDSVNQSVGRGGINTSLSGRDLAGQLIDCSAPIDSARNLSLSQIVKRYVTGGDLASLPINVGTIAKDWLKGKTGVDQGESIWDIIASAAEASGQYVWMSADGELMIGNPFNVPQPATKPQLYLYSDDRRSQNNVLDVDYQADISNVYSSITVVGQNDKGKNFKAKVTDTTLPFKRSKIISSSRADNQKEAEQYAQKAMQDALLDAYELAVSVSGWTTPSNSPQSSQQAGGGQKGEAWKTGWQVSFDSDVLPRACGDWVIFGRTFELSRANGRTTELRLKRKANWMQPVKYADLIKK